MRKKLVVASMLCGLCALGGLLVVTGCKPTAGKMSEMPYYVKTMDERWGIALEDFKTNPDKGIGMLKVLLSDLDGLKMTMQEKYQESNRDAAMAKLEEVVTSFRADLEKQVDLMPVEARLLPGVQAKDVQPTVEKAYNMYKGYRSMIKV